MMHRLVSFLLLMGFLGGQISFLSPKQQNAIQFRNAKVESGYPDGLTFRVEICGRSTSSSVSFYYTTAADATHYWGWTEEKWSLDEGHTSDNCDRRKFYLETKHLEIPPFSPIRFYWSVKDGGKSSQSSHYVYYYRDAAFNWKSTEDSHFVIWWHDRPDSFGEAVLSLASRANEDQAKFYSLSLEAPIIIVIVNSSDEFLLGSPKRATPAAWHSLISISLSKWWTWGSIIMIGLTTSFRTRFLTSTSTIL